MADSIAARMSPTDSGASVSQYVLDATTPGTYSLVRTKGPNPSTSGNMADIIVKVNWVPLSHDAGTADYVGAALSTALSFPPTDGTFTKAFAELPMHFIGHSRGTYVNSAAIAVLGDMGIWVDHCTILDGQDFGADGVLTNWVNIRFLDNYFQDLASGILGYDHLLDGFPILGAYEIKLSAYKDFFDAGRIVAAHARVHTWYHGTIDIWANQVDSEDILRYDWYGPPSGQQPATGFYFDRYIGGARPASGLKVSGAARVATPNPVAPASAWDNVEINSVSPSTSVLQGATLTFSGRYQDSNGDATITLGYDTDRNGQRQL